MSPRKSEGCFVVRNNGRLEYRFFYIDEYGQKKRSGLKDVSGLKKAFWDTLNNPNKVSELLLPEKVRMLDNRNALLFIRGERPVMDLKYDILKHPSVRLTTDGQAA